VCYIEVWDGQRGLQTGRGRRGRDLGKGSVKALQSFETSGFTDSITSQETCTLILNTPSTIFVIFNRIKEDALISVVKSRT